ncbi:hypothetical protein ACC692_38565, partial [Rhizobium ruizarguesonis]
AGTSSLKSIDWPALLATAPFFMFAIFMMVMPTAALLATAFVDKNGGGGGDFGRSHEGVGNLRRDDLREVR